MFQEIESLMVHLEDQAGDKELVARLHKTEQALKQIEQEKNNIIQVYSYQ